MQQPDHGYEIVMSVDHGKHSRMSEFAAVRAVRGRLGQLEPDAQYDVVIVGGGSAGCVLANRLSEDRSTRVAVLEAGRPDYLWDVYIHMPAALSFPIGNRFYDWKYESEPEPQMHGRRIYHARGKVLGGSSSINGMIFQRGNPMDYERWGADPGMESWDYAHCLPYFKRMETCLAGADEWRGGRGPLLLERGPADNPLCGAFFEAVQQAGYALTKDVNGYRQEGFAAFDRTIYRGRRLSAARAYLHPVRSRPNLDVRCNVFVNQVRFAGERAVGVEVVEHGQTRIIHAGEVILCGGAINSPQLLQLSGVGNADELSPLGIDVVHDLPGVGESMQDHLEVYVQYASKQPVSVAPAMKWRNRPSVGLEWLLFRRGPGATNHFESGGFVRSNDDVAYPNLMFHFLPIAIRYDGSAPQGHGYQVHVGPMYSDSRGSVKVTSVDPHVHPALRFNYLSTEQDRREWIEAVRCARRILTQSAFDPFNDGELSPGDGVSSDEEILDWVARDAETALHPSCTCRMGVGSGSVVDPETLAVHGLEHLRIVDASVMPYVTNGNIYAPVVMVAEKAADLIRGDTPLTPADVSFYRHQRPSPTPA
jgi:choline dehydrogenase